MTTENTPSSASVDDVVLLPCPFCGSDAIFVDAWTMYRIRCGCCETMGGGSHVRDVAIEKWNLRDGDPCRDGCKIKRAVKEMGDSVTSDYTVEAPKSTGIGIDSPWSFGQ